MKNDDASSHFADMIQQGFQIVRLENDQQQQIAIQRPRDEDKVLERIVGELERTPEFAKKVYYSIPYKDNSEEGNSKTVFVEGIGINGSMAIARRWGNCATGSRILEEKDDRIIVEGVFMDYETNNRVMRQIIVSKLIRVKKNNSVMPLRPDKLAQAIQSGMSKAVRNAVLHGTPEAIKIQYLAEAKRIAGSTKTPEGKIEKKPLAARIKELLEDFAEAGVTEEEIARFLGKSGMNEKDYERLLGLLNALQDGYVKKESIFISADQAQAKPADPVNLDELI